MDLIEAIGPDRVLDSEKIITSCIEDAVALNVSKFGLAIETAAPISVPGLLHRTAREYPDHPALAHKNSGGIWEYTTYRQYEQAVRTCAKAFLNLGLEKHHSVCILGFNSPEWFFSYLGAIFAGGLGVGIYTTNSSAACLHCAESSRANIIVVQDDKQLQKILQIRSQLPLLKAIVQYEGEPKEKGILSWRQLMQIGRKKTDEKLNAALKQIAINQCCTLIFTSGTTGSPKGVMLNHDNLTWNAVSIIELFKIGRAKDRMISYLPLSHVAGQVIDIFAVMTMVGTTYFADSNALKGSLLSTLQDVRPTYFFGVPRVWEKIAEKMKDIGANGSGLKKMIASWAKYHGLQYNKNKEKGIETKSWGYVIAHWLILKRVRQSLGLDQAKFCATAAAPLGVDVKEYFLSLDIPLVNGYGMTEAAGVHTASISAWCPIDSIGKPLNGMQTKVVAEEGASFGELYHKGRNICMGYLNDPEKNEETFDGDGWLRSGDVGYIDDNGFVFITGRCKELLITSGGENIPPVKIEQTVKAELPYISNAVLIGDKRKYLTLLLTLKTEVDDEGAPVDILTSAVQKWLKDLGCPAKTVTEVLKAGPDRSFLKAVQDGIDRANSQATSNAQRIQKFCLLSADFSISTGELGPTMKIKRDVITEKYAKEIDKLYL